MESPLIQSPRREITVPTVQVDLGSMEGAVGRMKAPPVCVDATLKQEAMSTEELAKFSFPLEGRRSSSSVCTGIEVEGHEPSVVSSASSTASRESAFSDLEGNKIFATPARLERKHSSQINLKVTSQKISRNGRQTQRWHTDPASQRVYRMVTGCVPIVEGGRVLFVSASRKAEWILPKGGWEKDEAMEESAIRECFEEAGVLGVLGPRLSNFDYETRKAKKRRLESEDNQRKSKVHTAPSLGLNEPEIAEDQQQGNQNALEKPMAPVASPSPAADGFSTAEDTTRMTKPLKVKVALSDETSSVASDSSLSHTHIRMSLFVLYVSDVKSVWPESGRSRKVVDIDEAIKMCESRPEFQAALKEVKERNLHHLPQNER
jgi:8-oxo-dGTP pyrophosphatase MutT (NUDIX family)